MPEVATIRIRGARQHNLQVHDLSFPKNRLVVFTGVSGSGKSSLAFDTLHAEGQRRYLETLSSYARQFLGPWEKPLFDRIDGLVPTVAIEQKKAPVNPRSTVGTMTEIWDHLRVLWASIGTPKCPRCNLDIEPLSPQEVVEALGRIDAQVFILAPLLENRKGAFAEEIADLKRRGFPRVMLNGEVTRIDALSLSAKKKHTLEIVVDRLNPAATDRRRLADTVETALREGNGFLVARRAEGNEPDERFSGRRSCRQCGAGFAELTPQSFSFNSPLGMCPACGGLGHRVEMDPARVVPNPSLSIRQGAIAPWAKIMSKAGSWSSRIVDAVAATFGIDLDRPWNKLPARHREIMLRGIGDREVKVNYEGRRGSGTFNMPWEGALNTLMRRFAETTSPMMREYYLNYFSDAECSACRGARLRPEAVSVFLGGKSIVEVAALSVAQASSFFTDLKLPGPKQVVAAELLKEICARLHFLESVGLSYLSLDRQGPSLSGGEAQRIRLASQLGGELSGILYVLDEPSVGLHGRDNARLIQTLQTLRDRGNSVLVVEHDARTIRAADWVVDLGPGAGERGGQVVFSGPPQELLHADTLTGRYLSAREKIPARAKRRTPSGVLKIFGAAENNLARIDTSIPLGVFTAVTGVSGAGKSSLVLGILKPALSALLHHSKEKPGRFERLEGAESLDQVIHVDQSPIGRTPRSNPATYTGAFDQIREIFSCLPESRMFGFGPGRFSFNVAGGRCEACRGDGLKRVPMHFLPDVWLPCEVCGGRRYNQATLRVRYHDLNIADVLDLTVAQALEVFRAHPDLNRLLETLHDVGMDYVKLGQPASTLSGGEAQRVKLSRELGRTDTGRTLYILDEPTTGLHFDDLRKLLAVLDRLVDAGNTVLVIEHNLDVILHADHVLDLGPEGGADGGRIVAQGTPEAIARNAASHTGKLIASALAGNPDHAEVTAEVMTAEVTGS